MPPETALLESRALRESVCRRTEVLDKVKALELLPDGLHVTTQMVADYFEVTERAVNNLLNRHREELESNGFKVLRGADLHEYVSFNLKLTSEDGKSYPQRRPHMALWPRRAVLNAAMLLRDSAIARRVRTYLLNTEERSRRDGTGGFDAEGLGPVLWRMSDRLDLIEDRMERGFTATTRMLNAIGETLSDRGKQIGQLQRDVRRLEARMDYAGLPQLPRQRRRRTDVGAIRRR